MPQQENEPSSMTHSATIMAELCDAAERGDVEGLRRLLNNNNNNNNCCSGRRGRTVLHLAAAIKPRDSDEARILHECIEILVRPRGAVHATDDNGDAPLHCAARAGHKETIQTLLQSDADLLARNKLGQTPLTMLGPRMCLDEQISLSEISNELYIRFHYTFLKHRPNDILLKLSRSPGLQTVATHPVIKSFVHYQWKKAKYPLICNLFMHTVVLAIILAFIVLENESRMDGAEVAFFSIALIVTSALEVLELVINYIKGSNYITLWRSITLFKFLSMGTFLRSWSTKDWEGHRATKRNALAYTLLALGLETMRALGRFPAMAVPIKILSSTVKQFIVYLVVYLPVIIGFVFSFVSTMAYIDEDAASCELKTALTCKNGSGTEFEVTISHAEDKNNEFKSWGNSITKVLTMMTGEVELSQGLVHSYPPFSEMLVISYILLVPVLLINLLTGLSAMKTTKIYQKKNQVIFKAKVEAIVVKDALVQLLKPICDYSSRSTLDAWTEPYFQSDEKTAIKDFVKESICILEERESRT